jgi:uncharacterized membrane protein YidH (DUF202 family)
MMLYYLRIGVLLSLFNLFATMLGGASYQQALHAEARKTRLPRLHWLLLPFAIIVGWPINLSYTIGVLLGLLPKKDWQQLNDEYKDNH